MVDRGGDGVLVGTASLAAIEGSPRSEHYAATKGGMISMVRSLAVEFARHNVRAHAILPGWIETDMTHRLTTNETFHGKVMPRIPMRFMSLLFRLTACSGPTDGLRTSSPRFC